MFGRLCIALSCIRSKDYIASKRLIGPPLDDMLTQKTRRVVCPVLLPDREMRTWPTSPPFAPSVDRL